MGEDRQNKRAQRRAEAVDNTSNEGFSLGEKILIAVITVVFVSSMVGINLLRSSDADSLPEFVIPERPELDLSIINNATQEEFMEVKGIGEVRSLDIITLRESLGGFKDIRELTYINGISDTILEAIIEHFYGEEMQSEETNADAVQASETGMEN